MRIGHDNNHGAFDRGRHSFVGRRWNKTNSLATICALSWLATREQQLEETLARMRELILDAARMIEERTWMTH